MTPCRCFTLYTRTVAGFKQTTIIERLLGKSYAAHNALEDAKLLQEAYQTSKAQSSDLLKSSFNVEALDLQYKRDCDKDKNLPSLLPLASNGAKTSQLNKVASSGLTMQHLKVAYVRNGQTGIESLFKQKEINGHVRVTSEKKTAALVSSYLQSLSE